MSWSKKTFVAQWPSRKLMPMEDGLAFSAYATKPNSSMPFTCTPEWYEMPPPISIWKSSLLAPPARFPKGPRVMMAHCTTSPARTGFGAHSNWVMLGMSRPGKMPMGFTCSIMRPSYSNLMTTLAMPVCAVMRVMFTAGDWSSGRSSSTRASPPSTSPASITSMRRPLASTRCTLRCGGRARTGLPKWSRKRTRHVVWWPATM
mmetsp:Transcript_11147/g.33134  ORF Transcript_11147/g.33134 Transcript_11147/m.33134 type:complete len:203 (-) Transcript_11147:206-814(-)